MYICIIQNIYIYIFIFQFLWLLLVQVFDFYYNYQILIHFYLNYNYFYYYYYYFWRCYYYYNLLLAPLMVDYLDYLHHYYHLQLQQQYQGYLQHEINLPDGVYYSYTLLIKMMVILVDFYYLNEMEMMQINHFSHNLKVMIYFCDYCYQYINHQYFLLYFYSFH